MSPRRELSTPKVNNNLIESLVTEKGSEDSSSSYSDAPPDGGKQAWLQVLGSFFIWMNTLGLLASFGVFEAFYLLVQLRGTSPSSIAWIGSSQIAIFLISGVFSGYLYDLGNLRYLLITGTALMVLGMAMGSISHQLWHFILSQGVCTGLGLGMVFVPTIGVTTQWFSSKRALANGIGSVGAALGGIIFPIIFRQMQLQAGFGWAMRTIAFVMLITQIFALCLLRMRVVPSSTRKLIDLSVIRDFPFLMVLTTSLTAYAAIYIPFVYVSTFGYQRGIADVNLAFWLIPILNAASIPGRLIPAIIADKLTGIVNMVTFILFATGILCFAWIGVSNLAGLIVFTLFAGFLSGAVLSLFALTPFPFIKNPNLVGTRTGMVAAFAGLGALFGIPVAGILVDHDHTYLHLQIYSGTLLIGAGFLAFLSRLMATDWKVWVKF